MSDKDKNDDNNETDEAKDKLISSVATSEISVSDNRQTTEENEDENSNAKLEEEKNKAKNEDKNADDKNKSDDEADKNDVKDYGNKRIDNDNVSQKDDDHIGKIDEKKKEDERDDSKEGNREDEMDVEQGDAEKDEKNMDSQMISVNDTKNKDGSEKSEDNETELKDRGKVNGKDFTNEVLFVDVQKNKDDSIMDQHNNIHLMNEDKTAQKTSSIKLIVFDHSIPSNETNTKNSTRYGSQKNPKITSFNSQNKKDKHYNSSSSFNPKKLAPAVMSTRSISDSTSIIKSRSLIHVLRRLCESSNPKKNVLKALHKMFILLESLILIMAKKKRFPSSSRKKLRNDGLNEKEWPGVMEEALSQMEPIIFDASTMSVPLYHIHPEERNEQIDIWIHFFINVTCQLFNKRTSTKSSQAETNTTASIKSKIIHNKRLNTFLGRWDELKKDIEICRREEHVEYLKLQNNVFAMNTSVTKLMCDDIRSEIRSRLSRLQKQTKLLISSRRRQQQQQQSKSSSSSTSNDHGKNKSCFVNNADVEDQLDSIMNAEQKLKEFRKILSISHNNDGPSYKSDYENERENCHTKQSNKRRLSSTTSISEKPLDNHNSKKRRITEKASSDVEDTYSTSSQSENANTDVYGNHDNRNGSNTPSKPTVDDEEKELITLFDLDEIDVNASDPDEEKDNEKVITDNDGCWEGQSKNSICSPSQNSPLLSSMIDNRIRERLLDYMKSGDEMKVYLALLSYRSIAHFSCKNVVDYFIESQEDGVGIFPSILKIMETIPSVRIQEQAMAALCSIASHDEKYLKKLIGLGANKIFTASVENHIDSKEMEEASLEFIDKITSPTIDEQQDYDDGNNKEKSHTEDNKDSENEKDADGLNKYDDTQDAAKLENTEQDGLTIKLDFTSTMGKKLETRYFSELVFGAVDIMDEYKCYLACMGFRFISHFSAEERRYMKVQNGITLLSSITKTFLDSTRVQEQAMAALCNLALDKDNRLSIVREGIPRAVTNTLERYRDCNAVQLVGCGLLKNISNDLKDCLAIANSIVDADGILSMMEAIENNMECRTLIKFACDTLMNLASFRDSDRLLINRSGGKKLLKGLKPKYKKTSEDLHRAICNVIKALEKGKRNHKK